MKYIKKLVGERVFLSISSDEDISIYNKWLNDPDINRGFGKSHVVYTEKRQQEYIDDYNNSDDKFLFIIVDLKSDKPVGIGLLYDICFVNGKATLGILIGENYQGYGFGKEATNLLLEFGFNILNLYNIMLYAIDNNDKAINIYEDLGFKIMGKRRNAYHINGKRYDEIYMDITRPDFEKNY